MSKSSHARHEHRVHPHHHPNQSAGYAPEFGQSHRKMVWSVIIFFAFAGVMLAAMMSLYYAIA